MKNNDMQNVIEILNEEEYDSDAIQMDCKYDENNNDSNIFKFTKESKRQFFIIKDYIHTVNLHQYTFSCGQDIPFKTKYATLKEEILSNKIYNLTPYQFKIQLHKATKYIHSDRAKEMTYTLMPCGRTERVSVSQLLSVILYCCCTQLCTEFSRTFRKNKWNETDESLTKKHRIWKYEKIIR